MERRSLLLLTMLALTIPVMARADDPSAPPGSSPPATFSWPGAGFSGAPSDDAALVHLLSRITFGPRPEDLARARSLGGRTFLEEQLDPDRAGLQEPTAALRDLPTLTMSIPALLQAYPRPQAKLLERLADGRMTPEEYRTLVPADHRPARIVAEAQAARAVRALESPRQLEEVMVDFWLNHFNVYAGKAAVRWYVTAFERDVVRPRALGRFPDLLRETARHPAMLFYLDNWLSTRADFVIAAGPRAGQTAGLNENYARELLELHTLGVDGGYTQEDVREVARAFTGWTIDRPNENGRFIFRPRLHDRGPKVVLGRRLTASGQGEGEAVLSLLAGHPATARFIATKLVRRFVADDPHPALVDRVATAYRDTDGDIRAMLRTLLTAPEFEASSVRAAKTKKPFEFVMSAARAVDARVDARGGYELARAATLIGEGLYGAQAPTGYPDRAEAWVSAGSLLARLNFAQALAHGRVAGVTVDVDGLVAGAARHVPAEVLERLLGRVVLGGVSVETRAVLAAQLSDPRVTRLTTDDRVPADTDVATLLALVLGSPEFQRR
jgi:uncharacterized protein (DUF1800 family)